MSFCDRLLERARAAGPRRVVLPETGDARIREAAARLEALGIAQIVNLHHPPPSFTDLHNHLRSRRPNRFTDQDAARTALEDPLLLGATLVGLGMADTMVGGADRPTADVIRVALWAVGLAPDATLASSAFYMVQGDQVLTVTDCAVVPEPSPEQLAHIARAAARDRRRVVGDEPVVAFLSYSSHRSASGPRVDRVRLAVEHLRELGVDFAFDGELQGDAALVPEIAARKAPGSPVGGRANILVFPDLDSGNIAYKLVQRLGGWIALGPVLQGFVKPVADLSRGATIDDIVLTTAIAVLQCGENP